MIYPNKDLPCPYDHHSAANGRRDSFSLEHAIGGARGNADVDIGDLSLVLVEPVSYTHLDVYKRQARAAHRIDGIGEALSRFDDEASRAEHGLQDKLEGVLVIHAELDRTLGDRLGKQLEIGGTRPAHGADDVLFTLVDDDGASHAGEECADKLAICLARRGTCLLYTSRGV